MADPPLRSTPLQAHADVRLLLPLVDHPRAKAPTTIAWHVIEAFIKQRKLITSRDGGPGQDTGDVLCDGYITRAAEIPVTVTEPWSWLDGELGWSTAGFRPVHTPAPVLLPGPPEVLHQPPPRTLQAPVEGGVAWLGDLDALVSPGALPRQPRAQLMGCSLLTVGFSFGEGGIGRLVQPKLGEAIDFVLKPHRAIATEPGDSLQVIADRYGTTVQTLRRINPHYLPTDTVLTAEGDTLLSLAGEYGTTVEWMRDHNLELARWGTHTVAEGDTLKSLALVYETTPPTLRNYNAPTYDFWPQSEPLPLGAELVVPLIRPSTLLAPGQELVVPLFRPWGSPDFVDRSTRVTS